MVKPSNLNLCDSQSTTPAVVCAIAILRCLDSQLRAVEPDPTAQASMDRVTRRMKLAHLEELIRCLNRAITLIGEALK